MTFRGLTWDHPRGRAPLEAAAARANAGRRDPLITWDTQPLEGFENVPLAELAECYDLIVFDHPHIGEAVVDGCLQPLEDFYSPAQIAEWNHQTMGPALASYSFGGRTWGLPIDIAMQVVARRADLLPDAPMSWDETEDIAQDLPVALSLAGPHAVLTLFSLLASEGIEPSGRYLLPDIQACAALERMERLYRIAPKGSETLNPIALLELMARTKEIALIPLIFGYVTYASPLSDMRAISFSDTPRAVTGYGGVLGGAGLGITRRCEPNKALLDHLAELVSPQLQTRLFPDAGGQPAARAAWQDDAVNKSSGGFYRDTLMTAEHSFIRPRFDGYIAFQTRASEAIRVGFEARRPADAILKTLQSHWAQARKNARGDLDDRETRHDRKSA
ncbi:MAG: extracellular solute-binding protein [Pseudomonadota bacterium]